MHHLTRRPQFLSCVLAVLLGLSPATGYAQRIDVPESAEPEKPVQPTPVEELSPTGEGGEGIPGTEPLYDKGITITEIEITGNKLIPSDTILKAITSQPGSIYSRRRLQNDLKKIYDLGYFSEHIRVVPIATREGVHLRFEVEENPVVEKVVFTGNTVVKSEELSPIFAEQIGKPQNVNSINKSIQDIETLYKEKGYVLARVENIEENPPGTITLTLNEGKIHQITFTGNRKTKDYVIRRAMAQKEGEVYNEKTVSEDMKRIFSLQSFSDVRRVVKASAEVPGEYDLEIEVDEKKTGALSLGGGIDTGTGIFGSVGYADPNFLGRGQNISTVFSLGTGVLSAFGGANNIVRRAIMQFQANWFNPSVAETNNSLGTSLYARQLASFNIPLTVEKRYGGQVTWARPFESVPGLSTTVDLGYENTHVVEATNLARLATFGITASERLRQMEDGSFIFVSPMLAYDSRDNRLNPTRGWLSSIGTRVAFGLDADTYQILTVNLRRYLKVTDTITFAINGQAGGAVLGDIPAFNMFRLGGSNTIRGFQEGGLGIGEQYLLGSAEIRSRIPFLKMFKQFPLYDMIQAALFIDGGTLFDEDPSNNFFNRAGYGAAVGIGLRFNVPALGALRIDWAEPITGNTGGYTRRFNLGVGQKF